MPEVKVILNQTDHDCCGERRQVGDVVILQVHNYEGILYEERHPQGASIKTQPITGRIISIERLPEITHRDGIALIHDGYEPGIRISSTEDKVPKEGDFQFTVDTDDPMPDPR